MSENGSSANKLTFSLKSSQRKAKPQPTQQRPVLGFETSTTTDDTSKLPLNGNALSSKDEPLVIPVVKDSRRSLQEQARQRRQDLTEVTDTTVSADDQAAIQALTEEAQNRSATSSGATTSKLVIAGASDTFQRNAPADTTDADTQQLNKDLEQLAPEVSVDSEVYRDVPIAEFGAAMLRGMGWTGQVDTREVDSQMPRPSRLGLGATPKLMAPTHGKRPRRQDQLARDEKLEQQQKEYEKQREQQIKLDKQRTIQVGSIVYVHGDGDDRHKKTPRRAIIRKWTGVPGLNMALVQFEEARELTKIKKGDIELLPRSELLQDPFQEPLDTSAKQYSETTYLGVSKSNQHFEEQESSSRRSSERDGTDRNDRKRKNSSERDHKHSSSSSRDHKRSRDDDTRSSSSSPTWLIPNIRVRVITHKLGKEYYKEKGVVVDVSAKGKATISMANGRLLQAPERYLETSLPKVGGNACILTGKYRLAKGKLLERDSRANRGSVQVFEDLNVVTSSLDDMAEWCGPLDDDLMD